MTLMVFGHDGGLEERPRSWAMIGSSAFEKLMRADITTIGGSDFIQIIDGEPHGSAGASVLFVVLPYRASDRSNADFFALQYIAAPHSAPKWMRSSLP